MNVVRNSLVPTGSDKKRATRPDAMEQKRTLKEKDYFRPIKAGNTRGVCLIDARTGNLGQRGWFKMREKREKEREQNGRYISDL